MIGSKKALKELEGYIQEGVREVYINLINWTTKTGPEAVKMLEAAGYTPDTWGPQRVYSK